MSRRINNRFGILVSSMVLVSTMTSCTITKRPATRIDSVPEIAVAMESSKADADPSCDTVPEIAVAMESSNADTKLCCVDSSSEQNDSNGHIDPRASQNGRDDSIANQTERSRHEGDGNHETASESPPEHSRKLRRVGNGELNATLVAKASEIVRKYHDRPFGTEIPFELEGRDYVGRIEQHYHPEGGKLHPWGYHPGCSLFVVEKAS